MKNKIFSASKNRQKYRRRENVKSWKTFFEEKKKKWQIDFCDVLKVP